MKRLALLPLILPLTAVTQERLALPSATIEKERRGPSEVTTMVMNVGLEPEQALIEGRLVAFTHKISFSTLELALFDTPPS